MAGINWQRDRILSIKIDSALSSVYLWGREKGYEWKGDNNFIFEYPVFCQLLLQPACLSIKRLWRIIKPDECLSKS